MSSTIEWKTDETTAIMDRSICMARNRKIDYSRFLNAF